MRTYMSFESQNGHLVAARVLGQEIPWIPNSWRERGASLQLTKMTMASDSVLASGTNDVLPTLDHWLFRIPSGVERKSSGPRTTVVALSVLPIRCGLGLGSGCVLLALPCECLYRFACGIIYRSTSREPSWRCPPMDASWMPRLTMRS